VRNASDLCVCVMRNASDLCVCVMRNASDLCVCVMCSQVCVCNESERDPCVASLVFVCV